jgi:16S rRNA (cytosine967-C5)-methyltransferase
MPPTTPPNDRLPALRLLTRWMKDGDFPDRAPEMEEGSALTRELIWGCVRNRRAVDAWIDHLCDRPPNEGPRPVLWLGFYQLFFLEGIADHAAVHESLEAARALRLPQAHIGFANALLRRAIREREALRDWMDGQPLPIRLSHPDVLANAWSRTWGPERAEAICRWNQERSQTHVRITPRGLAAGSAHHLPAGSGVHVPGFWTLPRGVDPVSLHGFAEGHWYVQDPSTRHAPSLLDAKSGEQVLDACAAPGGKTALLAEAMGQGKGLLALEPHASRFRRLMENLTRLGLSDVATRNTGLEDFAAGNAERFDAVLLDAPCSNTGVLQRRPDARWRFSRKAQRGVIELQGRLLDAGARCVAPGGRLVYSTCSIEPGECSALILAWLCKNPGWVQTREILVLPGEEKTDGAYAVRLDRQDHT